MKIKASWLVSAFAVTGLLVAVVNGCGDDDDDDISSRVASKGEACESTRDCAPGLACVPNATTTSGGGGSLSLGGICVVGVFNVAPTGKECVITECATAADCCAQLSPTCEAFKRSCDSAIDAGFPESSSCTQFIETCQCDETTRACENDRCVTKCTDDDFCQRTNPSRPKCVGGKCGQCTSDTECKAINDKYACVNSVCEPPCQTDGDCPGFERCVAGKCIAGGCQNDRECIYSTRNVEAKCGTDAKCTIPCQTDLECGNPRGYNFFSCIGNQCVHTGCSSDKDCAFFFGLTSTGGGTTSSGALPGRGLNEHVYCREKDTPGATVGNPQR
ncbi:MAG: hypothetical protein KIT84_03645 [Labilithrix sp.]|nr:hypothetical protein [Labilithrix sp.]MCW5810077.1 hypothetical protein [Labilithrix sp.]